MRQILKPFTIGFPAALLGFLMAVGLIAGGSIAGGSVSGQDLIQTPAAEPYLLQMVRDDSVHEELRLSEEQIQQVYDAIGEVDPRWWVSRIMPTDRQQTELRELTEDLQTSLDAILNADQLTRLKQLHRQAYGTRMIRLPDVETALKVTQAQKLKFQALFAKTDATVASLKEQAKEKTIDAEQAGIQIAKAQQDERQGLLNIFTTAQQAEIGPLVGKSFNFAGVQRTYPRAPEFVLEGSQWLVKNSRDGQSMTDGQSIRMSELRGKVVAVYFYAFQCINCQRNFPHYQSWHEDLAGEGLVVIGIQTPETSAERSLDRVVSAMESDAFAYPVLFDGASHNWQAWGNTMWPTTYLIDKKGFIRRWWQGEMNWKGTPGEQQMRESIQTLLAEDS